MSFWEVYPEVKKGHCQKLLIITGTICFGFCIPILVILAPKKTKKTHFRIQILVSLTKKCYRNPYLGYLEPPKEYRRHCHRYLGKVIFFVSIGSKKRCQKRNFSSGLAESAPLPFSISKHFTISYSVHTWLLLIG